MSVFDRSAILEENLKFDIKTTLNKDGKSHTCIVHNTRKEDIAEEVSLVFFVRNYGSSDKHRYWTAGPSFLNIPDKIFSTLSKVGLEIDKELDETSNVIRIENGIRYMAVKSKTNSNNTVIYWTIIDYKSPFMGLSSQFTIVNSTRSNNRYAIATSNVPGVKSFNRTWFCHTQKMAPVKDERVSISDSRWVTIIRNSYDALGYITYESLLELLIMGFEVKMGLISTDVASN